MNEENDKIKIKSIFRRRRNGFILSFSLLFFVGVVVALALPPIYKSEATIQIEDEEIKEGFIQLITDDYAEKRISKINQQILSRPKLEEIVRKYFYSEDNTEEDIPTLVNSLRLNIKLKTIVSEMKSKPGGREMSFSHSFNLSYEGKDPETVQKVTSTLADLYIQEDIKSTDRILTATTDFLEAELERLKKDLEIQEKKVSEFKERHNMELPSNLSFNIQSISRLERELDRANMRLRDLNENKIFLESQLAIVEPLSPIVVEGKKIAINPNQRLKELNIQLIRLRSIYSDKHPDIKKIQNEIRELEMQVEASDISVQKVKRLRHLENKLTVLEGKVGPKHPDVMSLKKEISLLSKEVQNLMTETAKMKISEEKPDNPAYINLTTQINATKTQIQSIEEDKRNITNSIEAYQKRIEKTPRVEKELHVLTRDYEAAQNKYTEIWNQLTTAQVTKNVEGKRGGRGFSIASPAYLPTKPYKPNRLAIILLGFLIAIGVSTMFETFKESLDSSIKSADQLKQITNVPVLSSVSYITTDSEKRIKRLKIFGWLLFFFSILFVGIYFANQYVDFKEFWSTVLERLKMLA